MGAAVVTGDRTGKKGLGLARGGVLLGVLAALGLLLAPSNASAQISPVPGATDYCSINSSGGTFTAPRPTSNLTVTLSTAPGTGRVDAKMYGTTATNEDCIRPNPATCQTSCTFTVRTVCEWHCQHNHIAPYPWTVELVGTPTAANTHLVGWSAAPAGCRQLREALRTSCVVRMDTDQNVTAYFAPTKDTGPPSAPLVAAAPQSYAVMLSWAPSVDPEGWLAGYDIYRGSTHVARVAAGTTSYKATNVYCATAYSFRVEAFDWSGNEARGNEVQTETGACTKGGTTAQRPNTVIHVKPPKVTRKRTAYFHFGAAGETAATKFQCKLNRNRWRRCSGATGKTYRRLAAGRYHTFRVRAGNANGWDRTPARYTWRIRR